MVGPSLLLDTNVWFEYEMGDAPERKSSELVLWAITHDTRLGIAAHSLKDLFCLIERDLKRRSVNDSPASSGPAARAAAWGALTALRDNVEIIGSDFMDAYLGMKYRGLHDYYEDNLVIAACERMKADVLVTNDQKLIKHAPVLAKTPAETLEWLRVKFG